MKQLETHIINTKKIRFFHGFSNVQLHQFDQIRTELLHKFDRLKDGSILNETEKRRITHHKIREESQIQTTLKQLSHLEEKINEQSFTTICHIGIGGSITGPQFLDHTMSTWNFNKMRTPLFINNHDEDHINQALNGTQISKTLFIIVTKSGSTIEIQKIIDYICVLSNINKADFLKNQCIAVTSNETKLDPTDFYKTLYFDSGIGGRFSTTSIVSLLTLSLVYGKKIIEPFLTGAQDGDKNASQNDINNLALSMAIIRNQQQQKFSGLACIPYGEALSKLPPFLSQLTCESLGKGATNNNQQTTQQFSPILMTGVGPNAQHTFFQQIHQGNPIIPVDFYITAPNKPNQEHQLKQLIGQSISLYEGQQDTNPHHYFSGNRPSTITYLKDRSLETLGFFISCLENRIMFEGFLNNINCFDQPGVELGKQTTKNIESAPSSTGRLLLQSLTNDLDVKK